MNRLGFADDQAARLREWLDSHPFFELEGICTHLFRGDDIGVAGGDTAAQLNRFTKILRVFAGLTFHVHVLNSSAGVGLDASGTKLDMSLNIPLGLRPGIALYGIMPPSRHPPKIELEPVLSFRSHLVMLHRLQTGEAVSYNGIWKAKRESLIGVVPVGYADGFQRVFSNNAEVLCRGQRTPVVGTVCMDYFMIDLTDVETLTGPIEAGEEIVLIGEQQGQSIGADELAQRAATIPYEIFTRISERVPRHYIR
jgi:alanine racemase